MASLEILRRALAIAVVLAGCSPGAELHPEGPPMIEQVRLDETVMLDGEPQIRTVFGFGSHPLAGADEVHPVTTATAAANRLRFVIDELLDGSALEEVQCRFPVDDDAFARVPAGATADDVVRCTAAQDALADDCPGSDPRSLCLCALDGGCPSGTAADGGPRVTPRGASVGVLDRDEDGTADVSRLVADTVALSCGGIAVPIDLHGSFWTPSGNQDKGRQGGFDVLGPALVIAPDGALPSGLTCGVTFAARVADRDGNRLCAPIDGDRARGCAPGDTSEVTFTVEPLTLAPAAPVTDPGQSRTAELVLRASAPLDPGTLARLTVSEAGASYTQLSARISAPDEITITWTAPGGLAAATRYTIRIADPTDGFGQRGPAFELAFTTGT